MSAILSTAPRAWYQNLVSWNGGIKGMSPGSAALSPPRLPLGYLTPFFAFSPSPANPAPHAEPGSRPRKYPMSCCSLSKDRRSSYLLIIYKITKIGRALWLAERSVCMKVCKHGCGVKMFCFSRANHASTNLKKFSSSKLDKFTLFTHSFVYWNLENRYKESVSIFFA